MSDKISTEVKCSDCGKTTTVPFKPSPNKPVYCRDCLPKHREPRTGSNRTETNKARETKHPSPNIGDNAWSRRRRDWKT